MHYPILGETYLDNFTYMIYFGGVPLFFMVNGALMMEKFDEGKYISRMRETVVRLLVWEIVSILFFWDLYDYNFLQVSKSDFISYVMGAYRWGMPVGHFWFMRALISIHLLLPIIKVAYCDEIGRRGLLFMCWGIIFLVIIPHDLLIYQSYLLKRGFLSEEVDYLVLLEYMPMGRYSSAFLFFMIGAFIHCKREMIRRHVKVKVLSLLFFVGWGLIYFHKGLCSGFKGPDYGTIYEGYRSLGVLIFAVSIFCIIQRFDSTFEKILNDVTWLKKSIKYISKNTLGIYYTHCLVLTFVSCKIYPVIKVRNCMTNIGKGIATLGLCVLINIILEKTPIIKKLVK